MVVPAGAGLAVWVRHGEYLRIVDVEGGQVGDLFAFAGADPGEYLSAAHTRTSTSRLFPRIGEQFVTNRRRPILTLVADTSPGVHDMLIAACDPERYRMLGAAGHDSAQTMCITPWRRLVGHRRCRPAGQCAHEHPRGHRE
jgi:uncharacterized protein YcgI (DUF1989 family)